MNDAVNQRRGNSAAPLIRRIGIDLGYFVNPFGDDAEYPRLVGDIHHMGELESIVGLSGWPIFGLAERDQRIIVWSCDLSWLSTAVFRRNCSD